MPVFSPALIDSSIGIGLTLYYQAHRGRPRFILDSIRDNYELVQILSASERTAVVYIGGGTPKNWINDGIVMANYAFGREGEGHFYALQITTDSPHWGGLSGSTLDEAQSWGRFPGPPRGRWPTSTLPSGCRCSPERSGTTASAGSLGPA